MTWSRELVGMLCLSLLPGGVSGGAHASDEAMVTARVDDLLAQDWRSDSIEPSHRASDAEFMRRVSLDLTGVIPGVAEVRQFLKDRRPDKRGELVDRLIASPRHATHLARVWREVMLPSSLNDEFRLGGADVFERWLEAQFADNVPFDRIVQRLLEATGDVNAPGPGLFYAALEFKPEQLAASTSRTFLGVQIRCAQCHNHPFDRWSQEDFWGFAAWFAQIRQPSGPQEFVAQIVDTNVGEVMLPDSDTIVPPRLLDGAVLDSAVTAGTRRAQLSRWMTSQENPYFTRAIVNRVWAQLFGRGFVNPVDDFGAHNPPTDGEVLDVLALDFAGNGFNMQRLFRIVAATRAYQLSSEATYDGELRRDHFAVMSVKSLTADQVYDCLLRATCRREPGDHVSSRSAAEMREFVARFVAPTQGATEFQGGIPQALTMLNGGLLADSTHWEKSDLLASLSDSPFLSNEDRVEILFLATLSRMPSDDERSQFLDYVSQGDSDLESARRLADVLWTLLNTSEFILNH
jgi:Protein of unknown function (DUF1549)/Protein of unknown function (DUF1553)